MIEVAKAFFSQAENLTRQVPLKVVTDGLNSYPKAIREELDEEVIHEKIFCLKNLIEQSHRGIKQRYYPMMGFGNFESAQRFCQLFDEVKNFFRPRLLLGEFVSLSNGESFLGNELNY